MRRGLSVAERIKQSLDAKIEANTRRVCRVAHAVNSLTDRVVRLETRTTGRERSPENYLVAQEVTNALLEKLAHEVELVKKQKRAEIVALKKKVEQQQQCIVALQNKIEQLLQK